MSTNENQQETGQLPAETPPQQQVEEEITVLPCDCKGKCQQDVDAENCAMWLARTFKMTYQACEYSGRSTWHRDGKCCDCHPLFPKGPWGRA